jgi:membrane associated rhomboid family serine protease|tara:strand:+ start:1162 stop:1848 length:687 start_codon:yes stop_codon:yes gene_type:complete
MIPLRDDNPTTSKPIVTYFIIGLCILIFLIQFSSQSYKTGNIFYSYGLIPSVLMGHNQLPIDLYAIPAWLSVFTSMFMHGGFMHLAGNMLYMWIFADNIEDNLGTSRFLIFYFLSGVGAAMTQVLIDTHSQVPMVGASGAIGGILGAYLINYPNAKVLVLIPFGFFSQLIKIRALYVLGFWFILQFISSGGGVAYAAHIGGFISGIILILFFNKKNLKKSKIVKGPWG